ncbi:LacI family DNA-binding transcriptional regulator [Alpinimonas psychrophila]|uniref:DNA-binding LacI/PurR family transcriptional regulator n=1 Tax=Alpinimonas psychrophila TaxID=748908 RepID=A0A7W3JRY5_9MICO|nr:DNA-binding LacI/PurR family transcriptional regulator [Alpinimonas psychrophila]
MSTKKRPTIRDVALEAGVSKSLVSLVFAGKEKVSPERRAAVLAAANKLGFTPNSWARSLATGASNFVGILVVDLHNQVYTEIADIVRIALLARGHETFMTAAIIVEVGGRKIVEPSTVQALLDLRPKGILVVGDLPDERPLLSVPAHIPIVKVLTIPSDATSREVNLRSNDDEGMRLIVEHLQAEGHKHVVYVGPMDGAVDTSRFEGYQRAMTRVGLAPLSLDATDRSEQGGYRATVKALSQHSETSAIVCFNDVVAVGAQDAIKESVAAGHAHIALTGYDNTHVASLRQISITSIEQEKVAMALKAAELLTSERPWSELAGQDIQFVPTLVIRDSTQRR